MNRYISERIELHPRELSSTTSSLLGQGFRLALVSAVDDDQSLRIIYLFTKGPPDQRVEVVVYLNRSRPEIPSLSGISFSASRFEREMHDLFGIVPLGHPFLKKLVLHQHWPDNWYAMRSEPGIFPKLVDKSGPYPFTQVNGEGVYEIPVGPIHAGLIEPGHFRFSVVGETIIKMTARLWYLHKGVEKLFEGCSIVAGMKLAERISGDTAVGHGLAYCLAVEDALCIEVTERATELRLILLEIERIYNHIADIGAMCNDVGFGIVQAKALALREMLLRINHRITGHRLLRGGVTIGGAHLKSLPSPKEISAIESNFLELVQLIKNQTIVVDRFTGTAILNIDDVRDLGVVGVVARASGLNFDGRESHPLGKPITNFNSALAKNGDVMARLDVRIAEVETSLLILTDYCSRPGKLETVNTIKTKDISKTKSGTGIVEGWRGIITHRIEINKDQQVTRARTIDPSFFNWPALAVALSETIVPDFPLANKSFNLSYAGNDL